MLIHRFNSRISLITIGSRIIIYNNNYYQNNNRSNSYRTNQNREPTQAQKREPHGTVNQPANKVTRLNNFNEDHSSYRGMPYLNRTDRKTKKQLKILIDTGATACYIKKGIFENKNELSIYEKVTTVHGYSIIKYYHIINIFETRQ